jgi:putative ABC transport system permease protein
VIGVYRALLRLYPRSFRVEYGPDMCADFAERRRTASGPLAGVLLWLEALADVVANAAAVHWELLRQDLRYALRSLRRVPGFTVTAVLLVALGVGANTAAFSVADYVLLRPLPFPRPDRLVKLWQHEGDYSRVELSPANYRDWRATTSSFQAMGAYHGISMNLVGQGEPERLEGAAVTADLLPLLGVPPLLGRSFTAEEDREGVGGAVLLSYGVWQIRFGGDAGVVGRRVLLDGGPYEVIGVMPAEFSFPSRETRFWSAARLAADDFEDRNNNFLKVVGRLRDGVSLADAQAELEVVTARLADVYPETSAKTRANSYLLQDEVSRQARLLLLALCGATLCILLIACANLASLLLARAVARRRELALRTALGAGGERLVRQLLTESALLALAGGLAGLGVALVAVPLLAKLVPATLPVGGGPGLNLRVLGFAALVTALTGIGFGVVPAWRACGAAGFDSLRDGGRSGGRRQGLRAALVVTEVAASVVLLISAGLLLRALWRIQSVDPGFRADSVLTLRTALPWPKYAITARRLDFYDRVLESVRALPGVSSAAYISFLPMAMGGGIWPVKVEGEAPADWGAGSHRFASLRYVTPGFFETLEMPLRRGRDVGTADTRESPYVAVVSESFARRHWPDTDPIGRRFEFGLAQRTVVGVVGDIRVRGLEQESEPQVYLPAAQVDDSALIFYPPKDLVIRAATDAGALVPGIRDIVKRVDPEQPISNVRTLEAVVAEQTASRSIQARLLGSLAGLALLLAGVGIHGLLSYTVSSRSQEIGVRMALGARPGDVTRLVVGQGLRLATAGVVPGILLAYLTGRTLESLLASVRPGDLPTFLGVVGLCILMTTAGCFFPARRAAQVDPITALKSE